MPSRAELKRRDRASAGSLANTVSAGLLDISEAASDAGKPLDVPVAQIQPDLDQPRRDQADFNHESLGGLAASIREHGLLQPIVVWQAGDGDYRLVAGERRLRAVRDVLQQPTIPVLLLREPPHDRRVVQIIENRQRRGLSDYDLSVALLQELEERQTRREGERADNPTLSRYTQAELAATLGEDITDISRRIQVARFVRENADQPQIVAFRRGEIAFDTMLEAAREVSRERGESRGRKSEAERANLATTPRNGQQLGISNGSGNNGPNEAHTSIGRNTPASVLSTQPTANPLQPAVATLRQQIMFMGNYVGYPELTALVAELRRVVPSHPSSKASREELHEADEFAQEVALLAAKVVTGYGG